jgi:L-ascorbate metabolism protein UlaG (beta-lactamase superfamily)
MRKIYILLALFAAAASGFCGEKHMAKLLYQGHASFRITTGEGYVIYVDPFAGKGYSLPADLILVTHEHYDHTATGLVSKKTSCRTIRARDVLVKGTYKTVSAGGIRIQAVPAYNSHHDRSECVGFVITLEDGITVYAAGDTSYTDYMKDTLSTMNLDYALLPCDGIFNMDAKEAARCADIIGARHAIPVHTKPGRLFDSSVADAFTAANRLILQPGQELALEK